MSYLDDAVTTAVDARLASRVALGARLRAALDAFQAAERNAVSVEVTNVILRQLGQGVFFGEDEAKAALTAATEELRGGLKALLAILTPDHLSKRPATLEERDRAAALVAEIAAVNVSDDHVRLLALMRAIAAEVRQLMLPIAVEDEMHSLMCEQLDALAQLRKKAGVAAFVMGLSLSQTADWEQIASTQRRAIERHDAYVARQPSLKVMRGGK